MPNEIPVCAYMWRSLHSVPLAFPDIAHRGLLNVGLPGHIYLLVALQSCYEMLE